MSKLSELVARDIVRTMTAYNIEISKDTARVVALEALEVITLYLRDKAEKMSCSLTGMQDSAGVETVIGMLES